MKYQVVAQPLQSRFLLDQVVSYVSKKNSTEIYFLSKENYQIVNVLSIPEETFISAICGNDIILFHFNKSGYYRILNNKQEVVFVESEIVPEYTWDTGETLNLDRNKNIIVLIVMVRKFMRLNPCIQFRFIGLNLEFCHIRTMKRKITG
jgi:hypothetical protein